MKTFVVILFAAVALLQVGCGASAEDADENKVAETEGEGSGTTENNSEQSETERTEDNQVEKAVLQQKEEEEEENTSDGNNGSNEIESTVVSTSLPLLYKNALEYNPPIPDMHRYGPSKYFGGPNEVTYGKFSSPPGNAFGPGYSSISKLPWRRGQAFGPRTPYYGCSCCSPKQSQYPQGNDYPGELEYRESSQYSPYSQYSGYKSYY